MAHDAMDFNHLAFDFYLILFHWHYCFLEQLMDSEPIDSQLRPVLDHELIFHVGLGPAVCLRNGDFNYFYRLNCRSQQRGRWHCTDLHLTNLKYSGYFSLNLMMTFLKYKSDFNIYD